MPLAIQPITPAVAALAADLGVALQPGAMVNAQVLRVLDANLVRIAIGRLTLDATTMKPLQQGQRLQLLVGQTADAMTLTPVPGEGRSASTANTLVALDDIPLAPRSPLGEAIDEATVKLAPRDAPSLKPALVPEQTLTPQETRAVATAAQVAVTKQAGLSQLFANVAAALEAGDLPKPVAVAARQLLGLRQTTESVSADDLRVGLKSSGLLLEPAMVRPSAVTPAAADPAPDLKAALLVLKQVLSTWIAEGEAAAPASPAAKMAPTVVEDAAPPLAPVRQPVGGSVAEAVQSLVGQGKAEAIPPTANKNLLAMQLIASASDAVPEAQADQPPRADHLPPRNALPPPFRNGLPSPQPVALPTLPPDAPPAEVAQHLLADAEGALARQTLLQVASLPDRIDQQTLRSDPAQPRWNFEIPFVTPQGTAMAQFEIARDGGGTEAEAAQRVWRARFSLNIEPAGPVHALITYGHEATHVKMWAERPATAAQLRANAALLNASLNQADLHAGDIIVAEGAPAQARSPSAGHFLNRAT